MTKRPKPKTDDDGAAIMERMNEALKKMMSTPHETQKEMIERRRKDTASSSRDMTYKRPKQLQGKPKKR